MMQDLGFPSEFVVMIPVGQAFKPGKINIDDSPDPFYRYKTRQLGIQHTGRDKMTKTVLVNLQDVSHDLKVNQDVLAAYMKYSLSTTGSKSKTGYSLGSHLHPEALAECLRTFISVYVLCIGCHLPELTTKITSHGRVSLRCSACGSSYKVAPNNEKFKNFLINFRNQGCQTETAINDP